MKRKTEKLFLSLFLGSQAILFGTMILFAITLTNKVSNSSSEMLNKHALKVAEANMKERVENIISLIEQERKNALVGVESIGRTIYDNLSHQDEDKLEEFLADWAPKIEQMQHGELIQLVAHNRQTNRYTVYYLGRVEQIPADIYSYQVMEYVNSAPYCKQVNYRYKTLYVISSQESIDEKAKEHIYKMIHASKYGQDGYVWVNEILNYEGGDNYAICRIHPNLKLSEGQYLSTGTQDVEENYPYLQELEEIKEEGEVFHTYSFKNEKDDAVRERAVYSKLYEPFHWIIATATPLDDVLLYSNVLNKENQKTLSQTLAYTIVILVLIFIGDVILILFNNKKMKEKMHLEETIASNEIELKKADYEFMTGVLRRGAGEYRIKDYLENANHKNGIMIVVDLDDLKKINDTLGHRVGDEAIVGIADVLKSSFRQSDIILRYGGDEFVVFVPEEENNLELMVDRIGTLVDKVASISVGEKKEKNIHCSIGYATTIEGDSFDTLFSRADKALYYVKKNGKNNYAGYFPGMEDTW